MNASSYNRRARAAWILFFSLCVILVLILFLKGMWPDRRHDQIVADIAALNVQLRLYKSMNGFYPTTEQGLQALVKPPDASPKPAHWYKLFSEEPKDPWGHPYIYRCPGVKNPGDCDIFSAGPDGKPDTADDDWGRDRKA